MTLGMKLKGLTFILTEECNWRCSYCYQPRGKARISKAALSRACDLLFSSLGDPCLISFYGGEPLLVPDLIRHVVGELQRRNRPGRKRIRYLLTTNGSRLRPGIIDFLGEHRFEVLLSFDGPAQEEERRAGSLPKMNILLDRLLHSSILRVGTNSVFTPRSAGRLSESLRDLACRGVPEILFTLCARSSWDGRARRTVENELDKLRVWLLGFYRANGTVPLAPFSQQRNSGVFSCSAGRDRLALAADGTLWGCYLFGDYFQSRGDDPQFQDYCFGRLDDGRALAGCRFRQTQRNYARLTMDGRRAGSSPCLLCDNLEDCRVCPAAAAFSSRSIGLISEDTCWSSRLFIRQRRLFWREIEGLTAG